MALDFGIISSNLFPSSDALGDGLSADYAEQVIWNDVGMGIVPIGSIVAWVKSLAGCPPLLPNYVECNGQVLSNSESAFNGQTIPDLNASAGTARFLMGAATSGAEGGTTEHSHTVIHTTDTHGTGAQPLVKSINKTGNADTIPPYYAVVWVMRIY